MTDRPLYPAIARGLACRCPRCGEGAVFDGYLRTAEACDACGLEISGHRADDLPPYLVVLIAGHLSVGALVTLERAFAPSTAWLTAISVSFALALCLSLIRPMKGAVIGVQWANEMHGFSDDAHPADAPAER